MLYIIYIIIINTYNTIFIYTIYIVRCVYIIESMIIYSRLFNSEYEIIRDLPFDFMDFCLIFSICLKCVSFVGGKSDF